MAKYSGVLKREDSETNFLLSSKVKTTITMNGNHIKKVNRLFNKYAATLAPGEAIWTSTISVLGKSDKLIPLI